jgi:hypothetical protein
MAADKFLCFAFASLVSMVVLVRAFSFLVVSLL